MSEDLSSSAYFPQLITLGKHIAFQEVDIPLLKGKPKKISAGFFDNCRFVTKVNWPSESDLMLWIGNVRTGSDEKRYLPFLKQLPEWIVVYRGPAVNRRNINKPLPTHTGLWLRRHVVRMDNEG